jgi:hypothetical protein
MTTRRLVVAAIGLLLAVPLVHAQVVTTTNSSGAGSLRAVVAAAAPGATITFAPALSGQVISTGTNSIVLDKNVTIDASALPQGTPITISGDYYSRIFELPNGAGTTVKLISLTLTKGVCQLGLGAAILNYSSLSLSNCVLYDNVAFGGGGAIGSYGNLTMARCRLYNNLAGNYGGAICAITGTVTMTDCALYVNQGGERGGAIYNRGAVVTLNHCTLTGNKGDYSGNPVGVIEQEISGSLTINHCTVVGNTVGITDGISVYSGSLSLFNSLVAGNGNDLALFGGTFANKGINLIGGDPRLLLLGDYGGPTPTMPPRLDSPALDAGSDFTDVTFFGGTNFVPTVFLFPNDQRGKSRLFGAHVDIGAVELQAPIIVTNLNDAGPGSLREATSVNEPAASVTFDPALSGGSIVLQSTLLLTNSGGVDASALTNGLTLNGGGGRVVEVASGVMMNVRALTLVNGYATQGGGIFNAGNLTLDRCTLSGHGDGGELQTQEGGGAYNAGSLTLYQCTVSGNRAKEGGGIYSSANAALTVSQSTIAGNESDINDGSGLRTVGAVTLFNTIVAGNGPSADFRSSTPPTLLGTNMLGGDPMLAGLGSYGGPTPTKPPLPGSPVLDIGDNVATNSFTTDQRGGWRISGAGVDLGAVEIVAPSGQPADLTALAQRDNGSLLGHFTNLPAAAFTVYASPNVESPLNTWTQLGPAVESPLGSGQYEFTDPAPGPDAQRYYHLRSP